jgi:4-hydroxybenzoate polyprenyltransferase
MTALQASIGAFNDLVDAPRDATGQPWKPIPAGAVSPSTAKVVTAASALLGLVLLAPVGPVPVVLGLVVLAIGYAYDLVLKGTRWSWAGFALGIPVLPVFAWFGATGTLPGAFLFLVPAAALAGASLALANSLVDLDEDRASGTLSLAGEWGSGRTRGVAATLVGIVALVAVALAAERSVDASGVAAIAAAGAVATGATRWLGSDRRSVRERAWEIEAAGVGLLAALWVGSLALVGRLG